MNETRQPTRGTPVPMVQVAAVPPTKHSSAERSLHPHSPQAHFPNPAISGRVVRLHRRSCLVAVAAGMLGCRSGQYGHLLTQDDKNMVGSHAAGAATWNPLVDSAVAEILGRCHDHAANTGYVTTDHVPTVEMASATDLDGVTVLPATATPGGSGGPVATVCFVGIENKSSEDLGDFKDQLYEKIDSKIHATANFRGVSRRMVDAALRETRLRPDSLFLPHNRDAFAAALGRHGSPVDYLMFATITSGTTDRNRSSQRDYLLTLEMVNLQSGDFLKGSAEIRKGYSRTRAGKWWNYGPFDQADG